MVRAYGKIIRATKAALVSIQLMCKQRGRRKQKVLRPFADHQRKPTSSRANHRADSSTISVFTAEKILQITPEGLARRSQGSSTTSASTVERVPQTILEGFARGNQSRLIQSERTRDLAAVHPVAVTQSLTEELQKGKQSLQKQSN
jgi:hypothetical protein